MTKIKILTIHLTLIFCFCSVESFATVYDYRVNGLFEVDSINQYVSGNMQISDEFQDQDSWHHFEVTGFNLTVSGGDGLYDFSGDSGSLGWLLQFTHNGQRVYEEMWGINNSISGDFWTQPSSTCMDFFSPEMIQYEPTSIEYYGILAPTIALWGPSVASQHDPSYSMGGGPIWLTRDSAPVPEPSIMVLLGTGLLIPFFARRKNKIHRGI